MPSSSTFSFYKQSFKYFIPALPDERDLSFTLTNRAVLHLFATNSRFSSDLPEFRGGDFPEQDLRVSQGELIFKSNMIGKKFREGARTAKGNRTGIVIVSLCLDARCLSKRLKKLDNVRDSENHCPLENARYMRILNF